MSLFAVIIAAVVILGIFFHYSEDLPEYEHLQDYQPPTLSRIYADDGRMMAVVAAEQRLFAPYHTIPKLVIDAFLAAEDASFFQHPGVDYTSIARAVLVNLQNVGKDKHPMGASTITQQVAKNMLLSREVSVARKVKEAILATRMEKSLSKERILEIYLNQIFLGNRAYGVTAAALNYFNKSLDELSIADIAYLAALPKAPNNYHPINNKAAALDRRNWVIDRMVETGAITAEEAAKAKEEPLAARPNASRDNAVKADYFTEEVRRQLVAAYGEQEVLEGGLTAKTSLNPKLQELAQNSLRDGLVAFDRRQRGWRGAVTRLHSLDNWQKDLAEVPFPPGGDIWTKAVVLKLTDKVAGIGFADGTGGEIPLTELTWARKELPDNKFGPAVKQPSDVLNVGDIVLVEKTGEVYTLRQVPEVQGAIVVLDPHTGRVFAMSGGFSSEISQFNRAIQAMRQTGSSFKPFIYMAALDKGFTPSTLISDMKASYSQGPGLPLWTPENISRDEAESFTVRQGLEKSRNIMMVRIANAIGMPTVAEYAKKFGITDNMPPMLSFALGAKETTPLNMAVAYGMIVNGGKKITPSIIDRVQNKHGKTIWRADSRECFGCQKGSDRAAVVNGFIGNADISLSPPDIPDIRVQVQDPRTAYQIVSILEGVVRRGTAASMSGIDFPLAGKTGTTNDNKDAWFVGFTPDLVVAVYVGFDNPMSLGSRSTGSNVAVPIFKSFITEAIKDMSPVPFRIPEGLRMVRVNPYTGSLALPSDRTAIWEAFIPDTEPEEGRSRRIFKSTVPNIASDGFYEGLGSEETSERYYDSYPADRRIRRDAESGYIDEDWHMDNADYTYQQDRRSVEPARQNNESTDITGTGGLY